MNATKFIDTNILLYAYDLAEPRKRQVALKIIQTAWDTPGHVAVSVQVLQEMHVHLMRLGSSQSEAANRVRTFLFWPVVETTVALVNSALDEQARWKISFWDSLILAAARASGAVELITEDLNHLQDYAGVKVINPFR